MDIKQQTKNVAAQGRFGDSMLLHVNPAEVKGLTSSMPITTNPETGQPEAFLPFLAPMLGSLLGSTFLTGAGAGTLGGLIGAKGLSAAAAAGIGAGLATYGQTGGSGSKALLSGLTAGLGTKALGTQAQAVDPSIVARDTGAAESLKTIFTQPEVLASEGVKAANPFDLGVKSLGSAAMTPTGMGAATAAGTGAVMQSQEEFERMLAQMDIDEEERKRLMYERYPEQIPIASGGKIGFQRGRNVNISYDPIMNMNYGGYNTNASRAPIARRANPIPFGFMPGFMPEFSYFQNLNPTATSIQGGFQQPIQPLAPPGGFRNEGRFMPPQRFGGFGNPFMQTPSYQSFYGNPQMGAMFNPYARFNQQPIQPYFPQPPVNTPPPPPVDIPPPSDGGDPPSDGPIIPPFDDGIGRKGRTRSIEPISPPDDFITPGPIDRPEPMPIMEPQPVRGPIRPINKPMPIDIPINQPQPALPISNDRPRFEPITPINQPIIKDTPPPTVTIPIEGGADVTIPDFSKKNIPNPRDNFMSIERIGDNRTNEQLRPQGIKPIPDFRATKDRGELIESIDRIGNNPPKIGQITDMRARYDGPPLQAKPFTPLSPAAPGNTPTMQQFRPPMSGGIFGAPMFAEGGDTDKELPNKGLEALYASGEKGREAVEAMGYQEGQDINMPTGQSTDMMMQDPIVQEVIQFILGETDNNEIINEFIVKYGQEQLMMLRDMVLKQAAGNPNVQTEGLIEGNGNSGMADDLPMNIGNKAIAAVSQDEYIIPADVVSMLGDGSSDAGSKQLDSMLDRIRTEKTGTTKQAKPLNTSKVLPV